MHNIHIGVKKEFHEKLEELLSDVCYRKTMFYKNVVFDFDKEDWCHPHNPLPAEVLAYLESIGNENYGFVRVNKSEFDVEVHGSPNSVSIDVNIGVRVL